MTDRAAIIAALQPDYAVASRVMRGVSLRPAPAVLMAELILADEGMSAFFENPVALVDDEEFLAAIDDPDQLRSLFARLLEHSAMHLDERTRARLLATRGDTFVGLALDAFVVTMPMPVHKLFKVRRSASSSPIGVDDDPEDIALDVIKTAERLRVSGYPDAFSMSWTRLRFAEAVIDEARRDAMGDMAVSGRVAQADTKHFKDFIRDIGR